MGPAKSGKIGRASRRPFSVGEPPTADGPAAATAPPPRDSMSEALGHHTRAEQDEIQIRTFTRWWNTHLFQCEPPLHMDDLCEEIKPGIKAIKLLEVLSQSSCGKYAKKPISKFQKLENLNIFLAQLKARQIKLVNIGAEDLVEGDKKLVLGLTWTLILRYEIHKFGAVEKDVLAWAKGLMKQTSGKDLVGGWAEAFSDGQAFCHIVHDAVPEAIDIEATKKMEPEPALAAAFDAAENHLNVPKLLEPSDFVGDKPVDDKSVILYVAKLKQAHDDKINARESDEATRLAEAKAEEEAAKAAAEEAAAAAEAAQKTAEAAAKAKAAADAAAAKAEAEAEATRKALQDKAHGAWVRLRAATAVLGAHFVAAERVAEREKALEAEKAAQAAKQKAQEEEAAKKAAEEEAARKATEAAAAKELAEAEVARRAAEEKAAADKAAAEKAAAAKAAAEAEAARKAAEEEAARKAQEEARLAAEKAAKEAAEAAEREERERAERAAKEAEEARLAAEAKAARKAAEEEEARQAAEEAARRAAEEKAAAEAAAAFAL
jgi:hypothetical protein